LTLAYLGTRICSIVSFSEVVVVGKGGREGGGREGERRRGRRRRMARTLDEGMQQGELLGGGHGVGL